MEHVKAQDFVILCLVLQNLALIFENVWTFSLYVNVVYFSLPMGILKAVSSNSINSPQNLLLVEIYYGIGNLCQFAL